MEKISIPRNDVCIVGINFKDRNNHVKKLNIGDELILKRDFDNPHDANAIQALDTDNHILGYVTADLACILAKKWILESIIKLQ